MSLETGEVRPVEVRSGFTDLQWRKHELIVFWRESGVAAGRLASEQ